MIRENYRLTLPDTDLSGIQAQHYINGILMIGGVTPVVAIVHSKAECFELMERMTFLSWKGMYGFEAKVKGSHLPDRSSVISTQIIGPVASRLIEIADMKLCIDRLKDFEAFRHVDSAIRN
jgi:hypothetical protein